MRYADFASVDIRLFFSFIYLNKLMNVLCIFIATAFMDVNKWETGEHIPHF